MAMYHTGTSVHRGDAFDVFYGDSRVPSLVIVRRHDGAERLLQGDDASSLESVLDIYGSVFDNAAAYVERADHHLSEYFRNYDNYN